MLLSISDHCIGFLSHADLPSKPSCFFHVYFYHSRWIYSVMWHSQQHLFPPWRRVKALWWLFLPSQVSVFNWHKCWSCGTSSSQHIVFLCVLQPLNAFSSCAFYTSKHDGGWLAFLFSGRRSLCCTILHSFGTLLFTHHVPRSACSAPVPHSQAHLSCISDTALRPSCWLWPAWMTGCWVAEPTVRDGKAEESLQCVLKGAASPYTSSHYGSSLPCDVMCLGVKEMS